MRPVASAAGSVGPDETRGQFEGIEILRRPPRGVAPNAAAWEMVGAGRYMPRRIRGSFRGRELG